MMAMTKSSPWKVRYPITDLLFLSLWGQSPVLLGSINGLFNGALGFRPSFKAK
jgi:hypothetical protein